MPMLVRWVCGPTAMLDGAERHWSAAGIAELLHIERFRPVMDVLSQAKDKGRVRAIGVSCHGIEPLRAAVNCDWVEVDLARINPVGGNPGRMDGTPEEVSTCLKAMHEKGKGILGMKILAEGTLKTEEKQLQSLRFVLGLGCVDAMVIGFESPEQIDQVMQRVETVLSA